MAGRRGSNPGATAEPRYEESKDHSVPAIVGHRRKSRRCADDTRSPPRVSYMKRPQAAEKAHLLRWRPWPHAQRTGSTPRVRPAGAASPLDLLSSLRVLSNPATSVSEYRGAPRLRRGAPSVGGYGGPFRGPPCF